MLTAAALICFLIGLAHSVLGERYILIRLFRRSDLPKLFGDDTFTRQTLRFAWHLTTVAWWGFGALLIAAAMPVADFRATFLLLVAGVFCASAFIALFASRGRHLSWLAFLAVAILTYASA